MKKALWNEGEKACRHLENQYALWERRPQIDTWLPGGRLLLRSMFKADWRAVVDEFVRRAQVDVHEISLSSWCLNNSIRDLLEGLKSSKQPGPGVVLLTDAELLSAESSFYSSWWERAFQLQMRSLLSRRPPVQSPEELEAITNQFFIGGVDFSMVSVATGNLNLFEPVNLMGPSNDELLDQIRHLGSMLRLSHQSTFDAEAILRQAVQSYDPSVFMNAWISRALVNRPSLADEFSEKAEYQPVPTSTDKLAAPTGDTSWRDESVKVKAALRRHQEIVTMLISVFCTVVTTISQWGDQVEISINAEEHVGFQVTARRADRTATLETHLPNSLRGNPVTTVYFKGPGSCDYIHHSTHQYAMPALRTMRKLLKVRL